MKCLPVCMVIAVLSLAILNGCTPARGGTVGQSGTVPDTDALASRTLPGTTVSIEQAHGYLAEGSGVVFVDVRNEAVYDAGHLEGAMSIPVEDLQERAGGIPRGRPVIVYAECR